MRVALDNNILVALVNEATTQFKSPETGAIVSYPTERAEELLRQVLQVRGEIIVPAPVWGEFLQVSSSNRDTLRDHKDLHILPLDQLAAEQAAMNEPILSGGQRDGKTAQAVKVDHQVLAICQAHGVDHLYTHDRSLFNKAKRLGISCSGLEGIELPEHARQTALNLEDTPSGSGLSE